MKKTSKSKKLQKIQQKRVKAVKEPVASFASFISTNDGCPRGDGGDSGVSIGPSQCQSSGSQLFQAARGACRLEALVDDDAGVIRVDLRAAAPDVGIVESLQKGRSEARVRLHLQDAAVEIERGMNPRIG